MARRIAVTVHDTARVDAVTAFDAIVPIDLTRMMHGYGPLPAVTGVREQTGPWDHVDATRTIDLSDGSETPERITRYEHPRRFGYLVGPFTGAFGRIVHDATGDWRFDDAPAGTAIAWTYAFRPRRGAGPLVRLIAPLWRRYAQRSLRNAVGIAEAVPPA